MRASATIHVSAGMRARRKQMFPLLVVTCKFEYYKDTHIILCKMGVQTLVTYVLFKLTYGKIILLDGRGV